jgi:hypothetical protein
VDQKCIDEFEFDRGWRMLSRRSEVWMGCGEGEGEVDGVEVEVEENRRRRKGMEREKQTRSHVLARSGAPGGAGIRDGASGTPPKVINFKILQKL